MLKSLQVSENGHNRTSLQIAINILVFAEHILCSKDTVYTSLTYPGIIICSLITAIYHFPRPSSFSSSSSLRQTFTGHALRLLLTRSQEVYVGAVYGSATQFKLTIIDSVLNDGTLVAIGAMRTGSLESLYAESGEPPLSLRMKILPRSC
jgi:hypothetical protein